MENSDSGEQRKTGKMNRLSLSPQEAENLHTIPIFGASNSTVTIEQFVNLVDEAIQLVGWSEEKAATVAKVRLQGEPKDTWLRLAEKGHRKIAHLDVWRRPEADGVRPAGGLRDALLDRYGQKQASNESVEVTLHNLNQKAGERVEDFTTRVEDAVDAYMNNVSGADQECDCFKAHFNGMLSWKLRLGFRPAIRNYLTFHAPKVTDVDRIIKSARFFQQTPAGMSDLNGKTQVSAASESHEDDQGTKTVSAASKLPKTPGAKCDYCGLENHTKQQCWRRKKDIEAGINRDRCEGYPILPFKLRKKNKKNFQGKKKVSAAESEAPPPTNQPPPPPTGPPPTLPPNPDRQLVTYQHPPPDFSHRAAAMGFQAAGGMPPPDPYHTITNFINNQKNM